MPRSIKYALFALVIFAIIFFITMLGTQSVRDIGGLSPTESEYMPDEKANGEESEDSGPTPKSSGSMKPKKRITVRDFLVAGEKEGSGYSLYSYLLFKVPPTEETQGKYTALLAAFLQKVSAAAKVEKYVERKYLNVTYLPVNRRIPVGFENYGNAQKVNWILDNYNYARARVICAAIPGELSNGPFIYSVQNPDYLGSEEPAHFILQDMARAPSHLCGLWLDKFLKQAAREEFWQRDKMFELTINLRTAVAALAGGVESVTHSMDWWQGKMDQWIWVDKLVASNQ
ncbi:MAG: hypothetical protein DWQ05_17150 [Calditrichaeota bacterium]|nr:MAG: hypothetical protein DWQ05_17150 [Calditrichota bacterium]